MSESENTRVVPVKKRGLSRLWAAFLHSITALKYAFANEEAFRLEVYAFVVLLPLGLILGENSVERVLLVGSIVLLMIIELLNTAIEVIVNRIGSEYNELSGIAKDIGSACVLIGTVLVIFTWLTILLF